MPLHINKEKLLWSTVGLTAFTNIGALKYVFIIYKSNLN